MFFSFMSLLESSTTLTIVSLLCLFIFLKKKNDKLTFTFFKITKHSICKIFYDKYIYFFRMRYKNNLVLII